jgi:hypothetical protein
MKCLALVGVTALAACSQGSSGAACPSAGSLEISVADADSENPICDATVTLVPSAGGAMQTLAPVGGTGRGCHYFVLVQPGAYVLSASKSGYMALSQNLTVTTDGCTIESPTLALELLPTM